MELKDGGIMGNEKIHVDMFADNILTNRQFRKQAYYRFVDDCFLNCLFVNMHPVNRTPRLFGCVKHITSEFSAYFEFPPQN